MEKQKIFNVSIILIMIAGFTYVGLEDGEPTHFCESRGIKASCLSLSPTNKTCYNIEKGFRCTEGWKEIPDIEKVIVPEKTPYSLSYICHKRGIGCEIG